MQGMKEQIPTTTLPWAAINSQRSRQTCPDPRGIVTFSFPSHRQVAPGDPALEVEQPGVKPPQGPQRAASPLALVLPPSTSHSLIRAEH